MPKRRVKADPETAQAVRRELIDKLERGFQQAQTSEEYLSYLRTVSRFHKYSISNTMLIWLQFPDASHVAGFHTWLSLGRHVRKGEKGIRIFAPIPYRKTIATLDEGTGTAEEEEISGLRFRAVSVFDISQTEGDGLPEPPVTLLSGDDTSLWECLLWGEPERYARDYWERIPGVNVYFTGDAASVDADGYIWFGGRADEIIKIAGHRIGTVEVETAFLRHPAVAEAGVTGREDPVRGEVISAFVVLRRGHEGSNALRGELLSTVRRELGPVAVIGDVNFVKTLPKTRSGKIMRRVLKAVTLDRDPGDISTIEDEGSVEEAGEAWQLMKTELAGQTVDSTQDQGRS